MEKRLTAIKSIRAMCLQCCNDDMEYVRLCPSGPNATIPCPLHPYRMGKNPNITDETRARKRDLAKTSGFARLNQKEQNKSA